MRRPGRAPLEGSPLSLATSDRHFAEWVQQQTGAAALDPSAAPPRGGGARGRRGAGAAAGVLESEAARSRMAQGQRPVDALLQEFWEHPGKALRPAEPWDRFCGWHGRGWTPGEAARGLRGLGSTYGVPRTGAFARDRLEENVVYYWGNYSRVMAAIAAASACRKPLSLLGALGMLVIWDQMKRFSARTSLDKEGTAYQGVQVLVSILAWAILVVSNLINAVALTVVGVLAVVGLHGVLRLAPGEQKVTRTLQRVPAPAEAGARGRGGGRRRRG